MRLNDHEAEWLADKYVDQLKEIIASPLDLQAGGWAHRFHAIRSTSDRISEIIKAQQEQS